MTADAPDDDKTLLRHCGVNIARDCIQETIGMHTRGRGEYLAAARSRLGRDDAALQRFLNELERRADEGRLGSRLALVKFVDEFAPDVAADSPATWLLHGLDSGSQTYGAMYGR